MSRSVKLDIDKYRTPKGKGAIPCVKPPNNSTASNTNSASKEVTA